MDQSGRNKLAIRLSLCIHLASHLTTLPKVFSFGLQIRAQKATITALSQHFSLRAKALDLA